MTNQINSDFKKRFNLRCYFLSQNQVSKSYIYSAANNQVIISRIKI